MIKACQIACKIIYLQLMYIFYTWGPHIKSLQQLVVLNSMDSLIHSITFQCDTYKISRLTVSLVFMSMGPLIQSLTLQRDTYKIVSVCRLIYFPALQHDTNVIYIYVHVRETCWCSCHICPFSTSLGTNWFRHFDCSVDPDARIALLTYFLPQAAVIAPSSIFTREVVNL